MTNMELPIEENSTLIASNKVEGAAVYSQSGDNLGSIYNFMVDKHSGQARYAVLQFGGILGLGSDYYPIPWDMLSYDSEKAGYVIDVEWEMLKQAPRHSIGEDPAFDRDYGSRVSDYYGLTYR